MLKSDTNVNTSQLLCALIVEVSSRVTSEVTKTTPPSRKSQKSSTLNNGAFKPTATVTSTSSQSSPPVLLTSTVITSDGAPADSHTVWIHVGVGIAALVIVVIIGILVSFLFSFDVECSDVKAFKRTTYTRSRHECQECILYLNPTQHCTYFYVFYVFF